MPMKNKGKKRCERQAERKASDDIWNNGPQDIRQERDDKERNEPEKDHVSVSLHRMPAVMANNEKFIPLTGREPDSGRWQQGLLDSGLAETPAFLLPSAGMLGP